MQMLHPFAGSIQQYNEGIEDPHCYRPGYCPLCRTKGPLTAHGFYVRTLVDNGFNGIIRVRRYLCRFCRRTVSLLPQFTLPYLRFGVLVIALFLVARIRDGTTMTAAACAAGQPGMPYQRGQHWIRRFRLQARALTGAMVSLTRTVEAADFIAKALGMLEETGWIRAHRFLFAELRVHLLGWPRFLAPDGRSRWLRPA
jgi:hypothetical protein